MSLFGKKKEKGTLFGKKEKPTREEIVFDAKIDLQELSAKCERNLRILLATLRNSPTPHEKEEAEALVRTNICAYTVIQEARLRLNKISTALELNEMLKELDRTLKTINRLGDGDSVRAKKSLNRQIKKMHDHEKSNDVENVLTDESQATVDDWLGLHFGDVANKYIQGTPLKDCMRESKLILERNEMPRYDLFDGEPTSKGNSFGVEALDDLHIF